MLNKRKEKEKKIIDTVGIPFCCRYTILMFFFNVVKAYAVANFSFHAFCRQEIT